MIVSGLGQIYDNDDTLTEPSKEDVAAFESSRKRLFMEQVFSSLWISSVLFDLWQLLAMM